MSIAIMMRLAALARFAIALASADGVSPDFPQFTPSNLIAYLIRSLKTRKMKAKPRHESSSP